MKRIHSTLTMTDQCQEPLTTVVMMVAMIRGQTAAHANTPQMKKPSVFFRVVILLTMDIFHFQMATTILPKGVFIMTQTPAIQEKPCKE